MYICEYVCIYKILKVYFIMGNIGNIKNQNYRVVFAVIFMYVGM